jgi:hypothetical protein
VNGARYPTRQALPKSTLRGGGLLGGRRPEHHVYPPPKDPEKQYAAVSRYRNMLEKVAERHHTTRQRWSPERPEKQIGLG